MDPGLVSNVGHQRAISCHALPDANWPVVISIPHAGRVNPPAIAARARVSRGQLARLSDQWCDLIAAPLLARGGRVVKANLLRAVVDCNRNEAEMDPIDVEPALRPRFGPPGRKARAGLGVVPTRLPGIGLLWRSPLGALEFEARLNLMYRPFHHMLDQQIKALLRRHHDVLLIDLHSMPPLPALRGEPEPPQLVIGDRFGRSAASGLAQCMAAATRPRPTRLGHNIPYAGGHIVEAHGAPQRGVHAVQIEFDRRLYLTDDGFPDPDRAIEWGHWLMERADAALAWLANDLPLAAE